MEIPTNDLIRRQDALDHIRAEMRRTYTAARRQGYKQAIEIVANIPAVKGQRDGFSPVISLSPAPIHSHWFPAYGWWLCDNCGGKSGDARTSLFCPHCGARMDEDADDIE